MHQKIVDCTQNEMANFSILFKGPTDSDKRLIKPTLRQKNYDQDAFLLLEI